MMSVCRFQMSQAAQLSTGCPGHPDSSAESRKRGLRRAAGVPNSWRLLTKFGILSLLLLAGPLLPSKDTLPRLAHRAVLVEHVPQVQLPSKALDSSRVRSEHLPESSRKACRMNGRVP